MNYDQIKMRLSELVNAALEKGVENPHFDMTMNADAADYVYVRANSLTQADFFYGDTPDEMFDKAIAFIAAMPDPATANLQNHMRRVADCIDKGREDGIDDAYITPLVAVKAAMTENLLAKPVAL